MDFIIGLLTGFGITIGIFAIINDNKKLGIIQMLLTVITPIVTYLFCERKSSFAFGGTDLEFLFHTATADKMIVPWIILVMFLILIVLIVINIYKLKAKLTNK